MAITDNIIINISGIWFGKKCAKLSYIILTRKHVISDPEAFLESWSETRMLSILLLWTPSLKYCSKLKGEYKNSKSGSGTSVGPSQAPHRSQFKKILVTLSLYIFFSVSFQLPAVCHQTAAAALYVSTGSFLPSCSPSPGFDFQGFSIPRVIHPEGSSPEGFPSRGLSFPRVLHPEDYPSGGFDSRGFSIPRILHPQSSTPKGFPCRGFSIPRVDSQGFSFLMVRLPQISNIETFHLMIELAHIKLIRTHTLLQGTSSIDASLFYA